MRKALIVMLSVITFSSCSKKDEVTNPNNPNNPSQGPTPYTPTPANVNGAFVGIKMRYAYTNSQIPIPVEIESEIAVGAVYQGTSNSNLIDAGAITMNSHTLEKQSNNSYLKSAFIGQTPSTLGLDNGANWNIGGNGSVSGFSYNHTGSFPSYTGTLPTSVTRSSGLTLSMSGLSNADSVYVFIAAGNQTVFKGFGGNVNSVTLTAADLQNLPTVGDNTAYLEVLPVKFSMQTFNGKTYAFIKERAVVASVNIN